METGSPGHVEARTWHWEPGLLLSSVLPPFTCSCHPHGCKMAQPFPAPQPHSRQEEGERQRAKVGLNLYTLDALPRRLPFTSHESDVCHMTTLTAREPGRVSNFEGHIFTCMGDTSKVYG